MKLVLTLAAGLAALSPACALADAPLPITLPANWTQAQFSVVPTFKFVWRKDGTQAMPSFQMRIDATPVSGLNDAAQRTRQGEAVLGAIPVSDESVTECGQPGRHIIYRFVAYGKTVIADETVFAFEGKMYSRSFYHVPGDTDPDVAERAKLICPSSEGLMPFAGWHVDAAAASTKFVGLWLDPSHRQSINVVVMPYDGQMSALLEMLKKQATLGSVKMQFDQNPATFCGQAGSKGMATLTIAGVTMEMQQEIGIRDGNAYVVTYNHPAGKGDSAGSAAFDSFCPPPKV